MDEKKTLLLILGLAMLTASRVASAAVVVAEPTGDADSAFLAELKASLETVAAEAPPETNAELRSSASKDEAGWALVVELVPNDGRNTIREARTVSRASALAQARAMARAAVRVLIMSPPALIVNEPKLLSPVSQQKEVTPSVETPKPPPPPPPPPEKYNRRKAVLMTLLPTTLLPPIGAGISFLGFLASDYRGTMSCIISGASVAGLGLVLGPSIGYFWVGRWTHALAMSGLRLGVLATGVGTMLWYVLGSMHESDESNPCEDDMGQRIDGCEQDDPSPVLLALSISALTASVFISVIDAMLVGRSTDRANNQYRKSQDVRIVPVAWANRSGGTTFGLAFNGTF